MTDHAEAADSDEMDDSVDSIEPAGNQQAVLEATGSEHKIEAVAGSGKTTTMVWRIRDDIREREIPPNRLLVLTFATEATHSIQEKLTDELGPGEAFEVDVYNYHSFCYQLLQEYAYYTGLSPEFELVTEDRRPQLIDSVYDEIDFTFAAPGSPADSGNADSTIEELTQFIERMRREAVTPEEIRAYLPSDETIRDLLELTRDLEGMAHDLVNVDAADLMWEDQQLSKHCQQMAHVYRNKAGQYDSGGEIEASVRDHLRAMADCAERVADHLSTSQDLDWRDYRTPGALFEDDRFTDITQTPMGRLREFVHMLRRARAYVSAYEAYTDALADRGALDYDELITRAVELLGDEAIREDILSQWDRVYCDEFQDTDESQLDLVEELRTAMDIMVIGDSDQAIHEWRGQDPENMSKLPDSFAAINLPDNFRSRQSILDITNNLGRSSQRIRSQRPPDPPSVFKVESGDAEPTEQVVTSISHLLTDRFPDLSGHDLGDIAVLVRRNWQVRAVARQCDRESIPYSVSAGTSDEMSGGLKTVLAYLRILVSPDDDVSWQRVLLLLYRVPEADISRLLEAGETVPEGYEAVANEEVLQEPEKLATAMSDYEELQAVSTTHSVSELYRHMKGETKLEWFLRETDRDSLGNIEQLISSFSESPIRTRLTPEFCAYLERQAHLLATTEETATSPGSQSDDAVDIMTVHQAKGLDFDTVLLPFLSEDDFGGLTLREYQSGIYAYDVLVDSIEGSLDDPLRTDISDDQLAEEWRILHVGLTRAKNNLFLFGQEADARTPVIETLDQHLPAGGSGRSGIEWSTEGPRLKLWEALMDSYDVVADEHEDAVRDYTDIVTRGVDEDPGNISYYGRELSTEAAVEQTLQFADQMVARELDTDGVDDTLFSHAPLGEQQSVELARQHSHTSLEAVRECQRRHVLDFVVEAFADPARSENEPTEPSQADIGTLFHEVAEVAYWRDYATAAEWTRACEWIAASRGLSHVTDEAIDCIETYFETPVPTWEAVGAEVPIEMPDIEGVSGEVTGYIDSVRSVPDGGLAVLDYKTSQSKKSLADSAQLLLYARAAQERFDGEITHGGYVYVGDPGPAVQLFELADLEAYWEALHDDLQAADRSSFDNYNPGPHCRFCEHRSLGCAPAEFTPDSD